MELAPSGVSLSFEVTFDSPSLNVGMSVYDDSGVTPVLVSGPLTMLHVGNYTYRAKFVASANRAYIIIKAVYTTSGLTILDSNYSQGSESIYAQPISSGGGSTAGCGVVLGFILPNSELIGVIEC